MSASFDTSAWDPDVRPRAQDPDDLVLLANESMRARRRPGAIVALWAWQAVLAIVVAWPLASGVGALWGAAPDGDAALWQPGGLALMTTLVHERPLLAAGVSLFLAVMCAAAVLDLLPIGATLAAIAFVTRDRRAPRFVATMARAWTAFPTFAALLGIAASAQIATALVGLFLARLVSHMTKEELGLPRAQQLALLVALVFALLVAFVGVIHDLARAAAIRYRVRTVRAVRLAMNTVARGAIAITWSWGWRALAGLAPIVVGALVASRLGGRGGGALVALAVVHQLAALARTALRASWLAHALRDVDRAHRVLRVSAP